jgi:hypothetical protein
MEEVGSTGTGTTPPEYQDMDGGEDVTGLVHRNSSTRNHPREAGYCGAESLPN